MPAPEGFTESEWKALGSATFHLNALCKCRACCKHPVTLQSATSRLPIRIVEPPPETVINRRPASQPWAPRPSRHAQYKRAA